MKLSIIMPAYNAGKTISMAVNSVVEILSNDVELIIVDDGSTDNTAEVCNIYQEKYQTIKVIKVINGGVSNARNIGVENARGEYIMFVDSDDESLLNKKDLEILNKAPEFVLFSYSVKKATGKENVIINSEACIKVKELSQYIADNYDLFSSPWAKIYKKELIIRNGLRFIVNQKYGEDTSFVFSYLSTIKNGIYVSSIVSYRYYLYANGASGFRTYHKEMNLYLYNILNSYLKLDVSNNYAGKLANYLFDKAIMHYYIHNDLKNFEGNFLKTYDYFKNYIVEETINNEVLKYKFPVNKKNIRKLYMMNLIYKVKNLVKKIVWR